MHSIKVLPSVGIETITPEIASKMLANNKGNRPISTRRVKLYARQMQLGLFVLNGESIIFDSKGRLLNGQHRLEAVKLSGVPIQTVVIRGVDPDAFDTIDNGKARTPGDVLSMREVKNATAVASVSRLAMNYAAGHGVNAANFSRKEITDFSASFPYTEELVCKAFRAKERVQISPFMAVLFLATVGGQYRDRVDEFVEAITTGDGLVKGDPRHSLREWILTQKQRFRGEMRTDDVFAGTARAWNAFVEGRELRQIKVPGQASKETVQITGYDPELFELGDDEYMSPAEAEEYVNRLAV